MVWIKVGISRKILLACSATLSIAGMNASINCAAASDAAFMAASNLEHRFITRFRLSGGFTPYFF